MDAKEFLLGYARMCNTNKECYYKCDLYKNRFCFKRSVSNESINFLSPEEMDKLITIVEKWCAENPIKTRRSEFLKMYPNAHSYEGVLNICPLDLDSNFECEENWKIDCNCHDCKKRYWSEPIKEDK